MIFQMKIRNKTQDARFLTLQFLLLASCFFFFKANAQEQPRPKIGLVLSGGGAKGFAHIGVLKVLEQAGIKIDYIGGTSMGAVVGGLYASGYNATQIDSIFTSTNFNELIQDYIPRDSKSFYEKHNDELYAFSLPFNKFSVGIPLALSKGMYNYNLLTRLTHHVRHTNDYNKLKIPFVCIATDIETGKEIIMHNGNLAQSMLASSAFPTLFSPVEIDGRMLIDGGVANNYPVEEVRKMGADIIIGVNVQDDLKTRKSLKEATRILVQISNIQMIEKMKEKLKLTDIYIRPDITDYNVISFEKGAEIIKQGETAAFAVYDNLKKIGNLNTFVLNYKKKTADSIQVNNICINTIKDFTRAYVIGKLGFKQGAKIDYENLKKGINKLNATQNFSSISYSLEENNSKDDLGLLLTENKNKTFLKFGLHYDGLYKSAILVNLTQKKSVFKNDILSIDFGLGDNFRYNLDYYIDNGFYWSFGLKSKLTRFSRNIGTDFSNGQILNLLGISSINTSFSDFSNQAYIQTIFAQKFMLGLGVEIEHLKIKSETLQNASQTIEDSNYFSVFGNIKYDSFDNKYFPRKGTYFSGDFQSYLVSNNFSGNFNPFSIAKAEFSFAKTYFKKATFKLQTEAGLTIGKSSLPYFDFVLGGYGFSPVKNIRPFYGYDFLSVSGNSYLEYSGTIDYEIFKKNHINFSANFINIDDNLFAKTNWISVPRQSGYALGYGIETIVGPIELKYSWSPDNNKGYAWISMGFWF